MVTTQGLIETPGWPPRPSSRDDMTLHHIKFRDLTGAQFIIAVFWNGCCVGLYRTDGKHNERKARRISFDPRIVRLAEEKFREQTGMEPEPASEFPRPQLDV